MARRYLLPLEARMWWWWWEAVQMPWEWADGLRVVLRPGLLGQALLHLRVRERGGDWACWILMGMAGAAGAYTDGMVREIWMRG